MTPPSELILVADDDRDTVRFIEANLQLEGFVVIHVSDGEEAVLQARERVPDLILLDVSMPKLDGLQVCKRLRADPRTKHIGVIIITGRANSADKVVDLTAGADDYIIKPFDPVELVARVKSSLRRTKQMRAVSPLTQLPGNIQVQEEISRRVALGESFGALYVDLDHFKSFNDHYGFLRGDECIKALAGVALPRSSDWGARTASLDMSEVTTSWPWSPPKRPRPWPVRSSLAGTTDLRCSTTLTTSNEATSTSSIVGTSSIGSHSRRFPSASPPTWCAPCGAIGRWPRSPAR